MLDHFLIVAAAHTEPNLVYIWQQATTETKLVLFALAIMSIFAWSVMTSKTIQMHRARKLNRIFQEEYKSQKAVMDIFDRDVKVEGCPLFNIYRDACNVVKQRMRPVSSPSEPAPETPVEQTAQPLTTSLGTMASMAPVTATAQDLSQPLQFQLSIAQPPVAAPQPAPQATVMRISIKTVEHIKRNMERSVAEESLKLESGLIMLAIAVSGSPFLGLLGTVWGVMSAFSYVAVAQSADLATMAPGVAGALIATVGGLLVAIPSMFGYNWLVHNLRVFTVEMDNFAQDLTSKIETEFLEED